MTVRNIQYIGRYGEVLKNIQETKESLETKNPQVVTLEGIGVDEMGKERVVRFDVSRKTGKKNGAYFILRPLEADENLGGLWGSRFFPHWIEVCRYANDLLHGEDSFYNEAGLLWKRSYFHRGRESVANIEKAYQAEERHHLRQLFSKGSVQKAIKTGNPVKIKSAMTRALIDIQERGSR